MDIVSKATHPRLWKSATVAAANERMVDAVLASREIAIGTLRLRCLQCHLGPGFYSTTHSVCIHQHAETQIEIPLSGRFDFTVEDLAIPLKAAQALVVPPLTPHRWTTPGGGFMLGIQVSVKDQSGAEVALPFVRGRGLRTAANPALTAQLRQLVDLAASGRSSAFTKTISSSLLMVVIAETLDAVCRFPKRAAQEGVGRTRGRLIFERTCSFIESNLGNELNAENLALQAGVSFRQLTRIFLQFSGESPHQHVLRLRLSRAQAMIKNDPLTPIKVAAYECGFSSATHFAMAFKKNFNLSPSVYAAREALRKAGE